MLRRAKAMRRRHRIAGILMICAWVVIVIVATTRPAPFRDARTVWVEFDSAQGIGRVDRDVRVAGTNVGEIGEVKRRGDDVLVELLVDPEIPIKADASAELRPHTLFEGSAFVDLHPGSPSAEPMEEGGRIKLERSDVYVSVDEALRVLEKPNRERLRDLVGDTARALDGAGARGLNRTLRHAPELLRDLGPAARGLRGGGEGRLAEAVAALAGTSRAVASRERRLGPLVEGLDRTLAGIDPDSGVSLDAALAALPGPLVQLREGGPVVRRTIARAEGLAAELPPAMAELAALMRESQPLLRRLTPLAERARPMVADLRTVLDRVAGAAPQLAEMLAVLRPAMKRLDESVLPALTAESRLGQPAYMQLVSGFAAATAALRPYQTAAQGNMGAGHVLRLGAYFDLGGWTGLGLLQHGELRCARIALGDPKLERELKRDGVCG